MAREEMISPELQRTANEEHCRRKGYVLEEVIEDLDASGRSFLRAGVQRAIERVEGAGVSVVVVWKFSRFARDQMEEAGEEAATLGRSHRPVISSLSRSWEEMSV